MADFKNKQTFLQVLNREKRPDGKGFQSRAVTPLGPRELSDGKSWIQVCSQLKPPDQGDFRPLGIKASELGGVALLAWRETSSGAGDQGGSPATSVSATSGHGPQIASASQSADLSLSLGEGPLLPTFYRNLPSHKS